MDNLKKLSICESDVDLGLLIGLKPWEVIHSKKLGDPFAERTKLGSFLCGALEEEHNIKRVNFIISKSSYLDKELIKSYNIEFNDLHMQDKELRIE